MENRKLIDDDKRPYYEAMDGSGLECIDAIRAMMPLEGFRSFLRGNAIKYLWRLGRKADRGLEDARKAQKYVQALVKSYEDEMRKPIVAQALDHITDTMREITDAINNGDEVKC